MIKLAPHDLLDNSAMDFETGNVLADLIRQTSQAATTPVCIPAQGVANIIDGDALISGAGEWPSKQHWWRDPRIAEAENYRLASLLRQLGSPGQVILTGLTSGTADGSWIPDAGKHAERLAIRARTPGSAAWPTASEVNRRHYEGRVFRNFGEGLFTLLATAKILKRPLLYYIPSGAGKTYLAEWIEAHPGTDLLLLGGDIEPNPGPPMDKFPGEDPAGALVHGAANLGASAVVAALEHAAENAGELVANAPAVIAAAAGMAAGALQHMFGSTTPSAPPFSPPSAPPMTPPAQVNSAHTPIAGAEPPHAPVPVLILPAVPVERATVAKPAMGPPATPPPGQSPLLQAGGAASTKKRQRFAATKRMYGSLAKCYLSDRVISNGECRPLSAAGMMTTGDHLIEWVNTAPPSPDLVALMMPLLSGASGTVPQDKAEDVLIYINVLRQMLTGSLSRDATTMQYRIELPTKALTMFGTNIMALLIRAANRLHLDGQNRAVFDLTIDGDIEANPGPIWSGEYTGPIDIKGRAGLEALPAPSSMDAPWTISKLYDVAMSNMRLNENRMNDNGWLGTTVAHNRATKSTEAVNTSFPELLGIPLNIWIDQSGVPAMVDLSANSITQPLVSSASYFNYTYHMAPCLRSAYSTEVSGSRIGYHEGDAEDRVSGANLRLQPSTFNTGSLRNGLTYPTLTYLFNIGRDLNVSDSHYLDMTTPVRKLMNYALPGLIKWTRAAVNTVYSSYHSSLISNSPGGSVAPSAPLYAPRTTGIFAVYNWFRENRVGTVAQPQMQVIGGINDPVAAFTYPQLGTTYIVLPSQDRDVTAMALIGAAPFPINPAQITSDQTYIQGTPYAAAADHTGSTFAGFASMMHSIEGILSNIVVVTGYQGNAAQTIVCGPASAPGLTANQVIAAGNVFDFGSYCQTFLNSSNWIYQLPHVLRRWVVDQLGLGQDYTAGVCHALSDSAGYLNKAMCDFETDLTETSGVNTPGDWAATSFNWNNLTSAPVCNHMGVAAHAWGGTNVDALTPVSGDTSLQGWQSAPNTRRAYTPRFSMHSLSLAMTGLAEWTKQDPKYTNTLGGNVLSLLVAQSRALATSWDLLAQEYLLQPVKNYTDGMTYQNFFRLVFARNGTSSVNVVGSEHNLVGAQQQDILEAITGLKWPIQLEKIAIETYRNMWWTGAPLGSTAALNQAAIHCPTLLTDVLRWRASKSIVTTSTWPGQAGDRGFQMKSNPFYATESSTVRYMGHSWPPESPQYAMISGVAPQTLMEYQSPVEDEINNKLMHMQLYSNAAPYGPCQLLYSEFSAVGGAAPTLVTQTVGGRWFRKFDYWLYTAISIATPSMDLCVDWDLAPIGAYAVRSYGLAGTGGNVVTASELANASSVRLVKDFFPSGAVMFAPIQNYAAGNLMDQLARVFPAAKRLGSAAIDNTHTKRGRVTDEMAEGSSLPNAEPPSRAMAGAPI